MLSRLVAEPLKGAYRTRFTADAPHEIPVMTSADSVDLDFSRRLNRGLQRIASATGIEAVLLATARMAHELTDAAGLCAVANDVSDGVIVTVEDSTVTILNSDSPLQRLVVAAAQGSEAIVQYRPLMEVELSGGRRLLAETLLSVPLGQQSGFAGLAFFWGNRATPRAEQLALLPGIAWTSCLALRSQQDSAALEHGRVEQRSQLVEFQHRVRNVLALVRSIIRQSGQLAESSEDFASHMEGRISAVARTQGALIIDGHSGPELEDLVRAELTANAVRDHQFTITGPSFRLSQRAAETIALTLHELATNALKFGALTTPTGSIAVSWSIASTPPSTVRWSWVESNVRIMQTAPQRRGFGRELIEHVLPYELGAETRFAIEPGGLRCEIDLPINERTTAIADGANGSGRIP